MPESLIAGIPYTAETDEPLVNETFESNNIYRRKRDRFGIIQG
jgi:hypothetical protein